MSFKLSNLSIIIVLSACILVGIYFKPWNNREKIIEGETHSYYSYLPAYFIYNDLKLENSDYVFENGYRLFHPRKTIDDKKVIDKTMGASVLFAPFFFIANFTASLNDDFSANGVDAPYKFFIWLSILFYLFIGLDFLKKIFFQLNFSDQNSAITIAIIGLGTNLFYYSSLSGSMQIIYNFCFISLFIYYTILWHQKPTVKKTIYIGLIFGIITLIKPNNTYLFLLFLFYGVFTLKSFKEQVLIFKTNWYLIWLIFQITAIIWIPQFIYWKYITGEFFYLKQINSDYYFKFPKIIDGLIGFRKGWLIYTPIMLFVILGIFVIKNEIKKWLLPIIVILIISIWVSFQSWKNLYSPSFGQFSFIDIYPLLSIVIIAFISKIFQSNMLLKYVSVFTIFIFISLNIFQTLQYENKAIHKDGMTAELYLKQFGKLNRIDDYFNYVKLPDYNLIKSVNGALGYDYDRRIEAFRKKIAIQSSDKKYVTVNTLEENKLFVDKNSIDKNEHFTIIYYENGACSFLSFQNFFVSADIGTDNIIDARREKANDWEQFYLKKSANNKTVIEAINKKYLQYNSNRQLFADADSINNATEFTIIPINK